MAIRIKTAEQIEKMRVAGRLVHEVLQHLGKMLAPGVTTLDMDREAERITLAAGAECLFKGVPGRYGAGPFPGATCISINEQVVHGIPTPKRKICDGDIVSIDFGVKIDGWCGDAADTFLVGDVDPDVRRLVDVTHTVLTKAIEKVKPGERWSDIAGMMQKYVEGEGFTVVREFVGHGIGTDMHEDPQVPNFSSRELRSRDIHLKEGMVLAVEPMVNMGSCAVELAADRWTVLTKDRRRSAHYEHCIAVRSDGADVLTDGR